MHESPCTTSFTGHHSALQPAHYAQLGCPLAVAAAAMTQRDCIATAALQGMLSAGSDWPPENLAETAYLFADTMLTARAATAPEERGEH